jgi:hypothetical protein
MLRIDRHLGLDQQGNALVRRERQSMDRVRGEAARFRRPTAWLCWSGQTPSSPWETGDPN